MNSPTLAEKLGLPPPESALLRKAAALGLGQVELEGLAVSRGCWHYRQADLPVAPGVPESEFGNEELAIALLSPGLAYSPHSIRVGAAMLGAAGNHPGHLLQLAKAEGCELVVRYIASAGLKFEPANSFWSELLTKLPETREAIEGILPHPTRFVSMTGFTRARAGSRFGFDHVRNWLSHMDNPSLILSTVDKHLDHEVRLVVYGRAAVCLGFQDPPAEAAKTEDVDAIISLAQSQELEHDPGFWDAIESANAELAARGLYITHLFSESEVFLRHKWIDHLVPLARPTLRWLQLFRPATIDLVLSKMMRGNDPQDMADASFMIRQDRITSSQLQEAFAHMKPIQLIELRDAFAKAKPLVLTLAKEISES